MKNYISREEENGITQELLKELFNYEDGKLFYKSDAANGKMKAGSRAGSKTSKGRRKIGVKGFSYSEHRIIFLFNKGYVPEFIDHKNGLSNKIDNLREATMSQNCQNRKISPDNTSGVKGVYYRAEHKKSWIARIKRKGKYVFKQSFYTLEQAEQAIIEARKELHGEFANNG